MLGLAALRLAVNLACFTKTRVCSSCFGSTNSGMRLFTKTQICISCFGSTNPGPLQVLNLRTALLNLMFGCGFLSPLSFSHFIVPVHLGGLDGASRTTLDATPLIRCISPMSSVSRLSHPFHLPIPRNLEFVAAAVLFEFVSICIIA